VEACVPAFDPDLQTGLSPAEADLDVLLGIPGGRSGRILSALLIESEAPLPAGTPITENGGTVGELRSCVRSFGLNATIGLGIIDAREALPGHEFDLAGTRAALAAKPFLRRRHQG
jgi:glycine cleavage system aminomethyltransferase T